MDSYAFPSLSHGHWVQMVSPSVCQLHAITQILILKPNEVHLWTVERTWSDEETYPRWTGGIFQSLLLGFLLGISFQYLRRANIFFFCFIFSFSLCGRRAKCLDFPFVNLEVCGLIYAWLFNELFMLLPSSSPVNRQKPIAFEYILCWSVLSFLHFVPHFVQRPLTLLENGSIVSNDWTIMLLFLQPHGSVL